MAFIEDRWVRKDKTRTPVYGHGLRYRVEWIPPGEKRKHKSFANKALADVFLAAKNAEAHSGVYPKAPARRVLFADYAAEWRDHQLHQRPSSLEQIDVRLRLNILPSLGHKALEDISRRDVQAAVMAWTRVPLAPSTVRVAYGFLAGIFKSAVLDGLLPASPCVGIRLPKLDEEPVRPIPVELVQQLAEAISPGYRPMVVFCAATGMRGAEMRGLTWDRVDLVKGLVTVDRQLIGRDSRRPVWGPPKTKASRRTISIGPTTVGLLQGMRRDLVGGLVFGNVLGRAVTRNAASDAWRAAREVLPGIGDGWHQLRHHHASILIAGGMSPVAVAHRLGHKDATETLKTYAHLWPDDDTRAAALTDGLILLPPEDPLGSVLPLVS